LSRDLMDLKERLGRILVAYTQDGRPVYARDLKGVGAMAVLMKDAVKPNLVQTLEGQPAFVHGGPFANIAHGNNTIIATQTALKLADYVVTEGGFGSDLGAEKFFDIVHGYTGLRPDVVILVATCRALKLHGGKALGEVNQPDLAALERGFANLDRHISNIRELFGLPLVVAINRFPSDTVEELELVRAHVAGKGVRVAVSEVVARGGEGGIEMAGLALAAMEEEENRFRPSYDWKQGVAAKLEQIARQVYGADGVVLSAKAQKDIAGFEAIGLGELPICVAKTQKSISDDPAAMGAPQGWNLTVREVRASAGAGFLVAICGEIMTMPGLPKVPSAEKIDIDEHGIITGLF
ncbi:MAG: formate--tetrahydrofolate ligase, partial [Thermaerobacter sp.]|nr:formate--tetrahydrofolate ligase [Thermaerobacter sp.]